LRPGPGNLTSTNGVFYNVTVLTRHPKNNGTPEEPGRGALGHPERRRGWPGKSGKRKTGAAPVTKDDAAEVATRSGSTGHPVIGAAPTAQPGLVTQPSPVTPAGPVARASAPEQARVQAGSVYQPGAPAAASGRASAPAAAIRATAPAAASNGASPAAASNGASPAAASNGASPAAASNRAGAADWAATRGGAAVPVRAQASVADQASVAARTTANPSASAARNGVRPAQGRVSVGRAGDPRVRGPVAPPRRPWRRRPRYVYRLADLDELFATAEARTDAEAEERRERSNRRSNWRVIGVVMLVAAGLAIATAGLVNEAVTFVMHIFAA
jgi:hypothetical protein